jgi:SAM-dependent methyltransferase
LVAGARAPAERSPAGGSLRTDAGLEVPKYVDVMDVHLTPGCFHSEFTDDDVAQGAVVSLGARVFTAQQSHRAWGGVAKVISRWIKAEFPHFSQQNAEGTDFPDGHFDLIVSSFFFHEIPVWATKKVLAECHRLLRPGGLMVHQELPAHHLVDAWENYFWNWDTRNNNEPAYTAWRNQDPIALMDKAGFDPAASFALILPDIGAYPDRTKAFGWDEPGRPRHGKGGWYVFGSRKAA